MRIEIWDWFVLLIMYSSLRQTKNFKIWDSRLDYVITVLKTAVYCIAILLRIEIWDWLFHITPLQALHTYILFIIEIWELRFEINFFYGDFILVVLIITYKIFTRGNTFENWDLRLVCSFDHVFKLKTNKEFWDLRFKTWLCFHCAQNGSVLYSDTFENWDFRLACSYKHLYRLYTQIYFS